VTPATTTEAPVTDPPATDPPVTDPPVTDAPVTDPPDTDAPITDAPVTEAPSEECVQFISDIENAQSDDCNFCKNHWPNRDASNDQWNEMNCAGNYSDNIYRDCSGDGYPVGDLERRRCGGPCGFAGNLFGSCPSRAEINGTSSVLVFLMMLIFIFFRN
jgi:hypothetical protein